MTQRRASPKALAMSASTDANPCGGMKKIEVAGVPTALLKVRLSYCEGITAHNIY